MLGTSILWQIKLPVLYEYYAVMAGKRPFDAAFVDKHTAFLRALVPFTILFYSTLWLVKLSFLIFFRRLGSKVKGQKIWWWFILVVTVLTWLACIADIDYRCLLDSYLSYIVCKCFPILPGIQLSTKTVLSLTGFWEAYCPSLKAIRYQNRTFYANCAADVITDCLSKSAS